MHNNPDCASDILHLQVPTCYCRQELKVECLINVKIWTI